MPTFGFSVRTARRDHVCDYCDTAILAGERYERWASADEGHCEEVRAHPYCTSTWHTLWPHEDEVPMDAQEFRRDCEEEDNGPYPWAL